MASVHRRKLWHKTTTALLALLGSVLYVVSGAPAPAAGASTTISVNGTSADGHLHVYLDQAGTAELYGRAGTQTRLRASKCAVCWSVNWSPACAPAGRCAL